MQVGSKLGSATLWAPDREPSNETTARNVPPLTELRRRAVSP